MRANQALREYNPWLFFECLCTFSSDSSEITFVTFCQDGQTLISRDNDDTVKKWDFQTMREIHTLQLRSSVDSVAISSDGKTIVNSNGDDTITVWDLASCRQIRTLRGHSNKVSSLTISPDGQTLVSVSWDNTIKAQGVTSRSKA